MPTNSEKEEFLRVVFQPDYYKVIIVHNPIVDGVTHLAVRIFAKGATSYNQGIGHEELCKIDISKVKKFCCEGVDLYQIDCEHCLRIYNSKV